MVQGCQVAIFMAILGKFGYIWTCWPWTFESGHMAISRKMLTIWLYLDISWPYRLKTQILKFLLSKIFRNVEIFFPFFFHFLKAFFGHLLSVAINFFHWPYSDVKLAILARKNLATLQHFSQANSLMGKQKKGCFFKQLIFPKLKSNSFVSPVKA